MSLYKGLFVRSASNAQLSVTLSGTVLADSLHVYVSEGLLRTPFATGTGPMTYVPESQTATAPLVAVAPLGFENVAILQISTTDTFAEMSPVPAGTISIKYGTPVAAGSGLSQYPSADPDNLVLAQLFTPAVPLTHTTAAVTQANINNNVLNAEFGGR